MPDTKRSPEEILKAVKAIAEKASKLGEARGRYADDPVHLRLVAVQRAAADYEGLRDLAEAALLSLLEAVVAQEKRLTHVAECSECKCVCDTQRVCDTYKRLSNEADGQSATALAAVDAALGEAHA